MGIRNHRPDLNGVLVVDKPVGMTSAAVVRRVRRATGGAKVGHAGTLDPLASGVLVLCLGAATKQAAVIMSGRKTYRAVAALDAFSTTDDAEGELTLVPTADPPSLERIRRVLDERFTGEIEQTPPAFSAVKVGGTRAYRLARAGAAPAIEPKRIVIHRIDVEGYAWPRLDLVIECGKGTYIRSIARDLGRALGVGGRLTALRRTESRPFTLDDAIALDELPAAFTPADLRPVSISGEGGDSP